MRRYTQVMKGQGIERLSWVECDGTGTYDVVVNAFSLSAAVGILPIVPGRGLSFQIRRWCWSKPVKPG